MSQRPRVHRLPAACLAGCLLLGCQEQPSLAPPRFGYALDGFPIDSNRIQRITAETGLPADWILFYLQWPASNRQASAALPGTSLRAIARTGATPCVTWEPMIIHAGTEETIPAQAICNGDYNPYIRAFAADIQALGTPVIVRFAQEMNLRRYHWGTREDQYGPDSPRLYRALFQHVVTTCRTQGATNILWAFCPNSESVPAAAHNPAATWNTISNYYPGHAFVDLLGIDGYNWGTTRTKATHGWDSHPRSFEQIFTQPATELQALAPGKPLVVFETASVGTPQQKTAWLHQAMLACPPLRISALAWFHVNKEEDWTLPFVTSLQNGE